jgi:hypothetical protein
MTPRPARHYAGIKDDLAPDDFDVLEAAVVAPRRCCSPRHRHQY